MRAGLAGAIRCQKAATPRRHAIASTEVPVFTHPELLAMASRLIHGPISSSRLKIPGAVRKAVRRCQDFEIRAPQ